MGTVLPDHNGLDSSSKAIPSSLHVYIPSLQAVYNNRVLTSNTTKKIYVRGFKAILQYWNGKNLGFNALSICICSIMTTQSNSHKTKLN